MVSIMRYIFLFSLVVLAACDKYEFDLDFELAENVTDNFNVTYFSHEGDGGVTVQAVASVREGKCELNGTTKDPTIIYITKRTSKLPLVLYVEKGEKLVITGDNREPLEWKTEGNHINTVLTEWRLKHYENMVDYKPDSVNIAIKKFVEENISNPVSTILMLCYFNRRVDEKGYDELMGMLRGEAKNPKWLDIIGRSDQMYHYYSFPARLENMVMRSLHDKGDTLIIDRKNPTLILFWETGYTKKKMLIDSIKALEKEFPDSSRMIADVCLDIDSVGWRNAIKKDSLYNEMKRFWTPTGLNDHTITKFKVESIPYFIVFDKEGHQSYRGTDLSEAISDYRHLFHSSDTIKVM